MRHISRISGVLALVVIGAATVSQVDAAGSLDHRKRELIEASLAKQGQGLDRPMLMDSAQRAAAITSLEIADDPTRPTITIQMDGAAPYTWFHLNDGKRFVMDLYNTVNLESGRTLKPERGSLLREVRTSLYAFEPVYVSRVVVEAAAPIQPVITRDGDVLRVALAASGSYTELERTASVIELQRQEVAVAQARIAEKDARTLDNAAAATDLDAAQEEYEQQKAAIAKKLDDEAQHAMSRVDAAQAQFDAIAKQVADGTLTDDAAADKLNELRSDLTGAQKKSLSAFKARDRELAIVAARLEEAIAASKEAAETESGFAGTETMVAAIDLQPVVDVTPDLQATLQDNTEPMFQSLEPIVTRPMQTSAAGTAPMGPWIPLSAAGEEEKAAEPEFDSMRGLFETLNEAEKAGVAAPEPTDSADPAETENTGPAPAEGANVEAGEPAVVDPAPAPEAADVVVTVEPAAEPAETPAPAPEVVQATEPAEPEAAVEVTVTVPEASVANPGEEVNVTVSADSNNEMATEPAEPAPSETPEADMAPPSPTEEEVAPEAPEVEVEVPKIPAAIRVEMDTLPEEPSQEPDAPMPTSQPGATVVMPAVVQADGNMDALDTVVDVIDFRDMELKEVVPLLAEAANVNVIAGAEVVGTVTFRAQHVTLRQALETVLNINNLGLIEDNGIFRVVPRDEAIAAKRVTRMVPLENGKADDVKTTLDAVLVGSPDAAAVTIAANGATNVIVISGPIERVEEFERLVRQLDVTEPELPTATEALRLNYLDPTEAKPIVESMLTPEIGKAEADARGRHIIVTDQPMVVEQIRAILSSIDTPTKQVHIEAMIIDAILRDSAQTGVDWTIEALRRFSTNGDLVSDVSQLQFDGNLGNVGSADLDAGILTLGLLTSEIRLQAAIAAEVNNNNAQILANPSVVTLENKPAEISIVQEFPYQEITQGLTGPPVASTEFKPIGVSLEVTPAVTHDNDIIVDLTAKQSSVSGVTDDGVPIEDKREATTTLRTMDGQTVFIGGLRRIDDVLGVSKVPVLGDIPVINFMFRNTTSDKTNTELLIFLTCNVKQPALPPLTASQQYEYDKLEATPQVPDSQRAMYKDYVKPHTTRDPLWKWRRTK